MAIDESPHRGFTAALVPSPEKHTDNHLHSGLRKLGLQHSPFLSAACIAVGPGVMGMTCSLMARSTDVVPFIFFRPGYDDAFKIESSVWQAVLFVLGFLLVFRASMAYNRYWTAITAVHLMRADWFDAASSLICFSAGSQAPPETVMAFRHVLVRLVSLCNIAALINLAEPGADDEEISSLEAIDPLSLDAACVSSFKASHHRVDILGHWIQQVIMQAMQDKVLTAPPPIITRTFQELSNGMVKYHDASKIKHLQFPKEYQYICDGLLFLQWIGSPVLVALYCNSPYLTFVFSYLTTLVFWSLSLVAKTIENPFRVPRIIGELVEMQKDLNAKLFLLLDAQISRAPAMIDRKPNASTPATANCVPVRDFWSSVGHCVGGQADADPTISCATDSSANSGTDANVEVASSEIDIADEEKVLPVPAIAFKLHDGAYGGNISDDVQPWVSSNV